MDKVMTRTQPHPGSRLPGARPGARPGGARPPGRRDTRRPAGAPPRTPDGGAPRTAPAGGRPPGASGAGASTRPADSRPATTRAPGGPLPQPRPTDLFADRLLAVLSGRRPVHFMLRHTLGAAYDDLAHLAERGPLRTAHGAQPVVRDIGYFVPRPGAIEAFARIGAGDRVRAMAFRLELGRDRRWRCTAVELDGHRRPSAQDD